MLIHEAQRRHWAESVAEPMEGEGAPPSAEQAAAAEPPPSVPFWQAVPRGQQAPLTPLARGGPPPGAVAARAAPGPP